MSSTNTAQLLEHLSRGQDLYQDFSLRFREAFSIEGKTLSEWEERLRPPSPPPDLSPGTCRDIGAQLLDIYQRVSRHKARAEAIFTALTQTVKSQRAEKYYAKVTAFKAEGGKIPAASTIEILVEQEMGEMRAAETAAQIAIDFWVEQQRNLSWHHKVLEMAAMASGVEAKLIEKGYSNA